VRTEHGVRGTSELSTERPAYCTELCRELTWREPLEPSSAPGAIQEHGVFSEERDSFRTTFDKPVRPKLTIKLMTRETGLITPRFLGHMAEKGCFRH